MVDLVLVYQGLQDLHVRFQDDGEANAGHQRKRPGLEIGHARYTGMHVPTELRILKFIEFVERLTQLLRAVSDIQSGPMVKLLGAGAKPDRVPVKAAVRYCERSPHIFRGSLPWHRDGRS